MSPVTVGSILLWIAVTAPLLISDLRMFGLQMQNSEWKLHVLLVAYIHTLQHCFNCEDLSFVAARWVGMTTTTFCFIFNCFYLIEFDYF